MGIREVVEKNKPVVIIAVLVVIAAAAVVAVKNSHSDLAPHTINTFYTDNDGSGFYGGELKDFMPNQRKSTYRAVVFSCDGGAGTAGRFVGYMMRYSAEQVKAIEVATDAAQNARATMAQTDVKRQKIEDALSATMKDANDNPEVKKPGSGGKWVALNSPEGQAVIAVKCPDRPDVPPQIVYP